MAGVGLPKPSPRPEIASDARSEAINRAQAAEIERLAVTSSDQQRQKAAQSTDLSNPSV